MELLTSVSYAKKEFGAQEGAGGHQGYALHKGRHSSRGQKGGLRRLRVAPGPHSQGAQEKGSPAYKVLILRAGLKL